MGNYYRSCNDYLEYKERDSRMRKLRSRLSLARLQGNKHQVTEITEALKKCH